jgi:DnaJ domain/Transmembrane Fragile-X-F protein
MRYDLAFMMCCCKSFLGSDDDTENNNNNDDGTTTVNYNDYYGLLGVERDATADELKRAYKKQSLQMHPDKLAQRGVQVTAESQTRFTKMKEAYEVLSDPHKRDTYDVLGARGVKWLEEPFAIDPAQLAHNFAQSSTLDRSKIFAIFVAIAMAVFVLPVLICLHVDGRLGTHASWMATLTPLWLWNAFLIFYHSRVILMGPIQRPEHIPEEEWVDPLPMKKRIFSMLRFLLLVFCEVLVALKLDRILRVPWFVVFVPLYIWEATTLYKKWPLARMRIVTVEDLEAALGKPFSEFTPAEKELIGQRYSVVSSTSSPAFDAAQKLKLRARNDVVKSVFRIVFVLVLLVQLDSDLDWNWWLVFSPIWFMIFVVCFDNFQSFAEVQRMAMEKDPNLFAPSRTNDATTTAEGGDHEAGKTTSYGAVGESGEATPLDAAATASTLTEEEREQLRAQVTASSSKLCGKCCSQAFILILICLFVAKLEGAGFSAFWIISPFLFMVRAIPDRLLMLRRLVSLMRVLPLNAPIGWDVAVLYWMRNLWYHGSFDGWHPF